MTVPKQERAVDPFGERRFTSQINRLTRMVTGGKDVVVYPDDSFILTKIDKRKFNVSTGVCIKDDVLIHFTEDLEINAFENTDFFLDDTPGVNDEGIYYIVVQYNYARSLPPPKSYIRIIRNKNLYSDNEDNLVFIGCFRVKKYPSVIEFYDPSSSLPSDPNEGDRYIASASGNGWTEDYIYQWDGTYWVETIPSTGDIYWIVDLSYTYKWDSENWIQNPEYPEDQYYIDEMLKIDPNEPYTSVTGINPLDCKAMVIDGGWISDEIDYHEFNFGS
ncbi:MAG: hypothetical protein ACOCQD_00530 [archaeon]